jgi:hypothetical protein
MNTELVKAWRAARDACAARGGEMRPLVIEPPATESRVAEVERALGHALPPRLRRFFLEEAASVQFQWFLPTESGAPFVHGQKATPRVEVGSRVVGCAVDLSGDVSPGAGSDWTDFETRIDGLPSGHYRIVGPLGERTLDVP